MRVLPTRPHVLLASADGLTHILDDWSLEIHYEAGRRPLWHRKKVELRTTSEPARRNHERNGLNVVYADWTSNRGYARRWLRNKNGCFWEIPHSKFASDQFDMNGRICELSFTREEITAFSFVSFLPSVRGKYSFLDLKLACSRSQGQKCGCWHVLGVWLHDKGIASLGITRE